MLSSVRIVYLVGELKKGNNFRYCDIWDLVYDRSYVCEIDGWDFDRSVDIGATCRSCVACYMSSCNYGRWLK